ncbi:MAG: nucleotidyltransferase family protein [Candidatus Odyssella sp.]|nr:nucleotidyltransferase family protein [Candidatus Odyssella sp.]
MSAPVAASGETIAAGMVLAAGLGLRMRPITERMPKPLVTVAGRCLLDRALDHYAEAGLARAVVNTHYLAEQIAAHVAARTAPEIVLSHEPALLETGGGVLNALPLLGAGPFFVANSDALWLNGPLPALTRLARAWNGAAMDALLLLAVVPGTLGYEGRGDFTMDGLGRLRRRAERGIAPFLFTGVQILHPRLFADEAPGKWSLNRVYDKALAAGRLYGLRHDGAWYHVGDPAGLAAVEARLRSEGAAAA